QTARVGRFGQPSLQKRCKSTLRAGSPFPARTVGTRLNTNRTNEIRMGTNLFLWLIVIRDSVAFERWQGFRGTMQDFDDARGYSRRATGTLNRRRVLRSLQLFRVWPRRICLFRSPGVGAPR